MGCELAFSMITNNFRSDVKGMLNQAAAELLVNRNEKALRSLQLAVFLEKITNGMVETRDEAIQACKAEKINHPHVSECALMYMLNAGYLETGADAALKDARVYLDKNDVKSASDGLLQYEIAKAFADGFYTDDTKKSFEEHCISEQKRLGL